MTQLQKVTLGTPPLGQDGDSSRTAFSKGNANVDVLNAQATLTAAPAISGAQALTNVHIGKRVSINLAAAGTVNLPQANTCAADNVILLRNSGTTAVTLAPFANSGDAVALQSLAPGESVLMDTDGVHAWSVVLRGRTNSNNEVVSGNSTINGSATVGGALAVAGDITRAGAAGTTRQIMFSSGTSARWTISVGAVAEAGGNAGSDIALTRYTDAGVAVDSPLTFVRSTGVATFSARPVFAGKVPWDAGNLANPMTTDTAQTIAGNKAYTGLLSVTGFFSGTATSSLFSVWGSGVIAGVGFVAGNNTAAGSLRFNQSNGSFEFTNYNGTSFAPVTCLSLSQASDARLKSNVRTIDNAMAKLRKFRGVYYEVDGVAEVGVIAQEARSGFPELTVEFDPVLDGPPAPGVTPFLAFKYTNFGGALLQALLETDTALMSALKRIDALEAKGGA